MKKVLILLLFIVTSFGLYAFFNGNSGGKCTGSKYCNACKNCSRCGYCSSGGVCGVCSPESFKTKPKPVSKSNSNKPKNTSQKKPTSKTTTKPKSNSNSNAYETLPLPEKVTTSTIALEDTAFINALKRQKQSYDKNHPK